MWPEIGTRPNRLRLIRKAICIFLLALQLMLARILTKYGPVGNPGGAGLDPAPDLETHGGIWRFDASKTNQTQKDGKRISTGIRSVVGMQWNNQDDHLVCCCQWH